MFNIITRISSTNAGIAVSLLRAVMGGILLTEGAGKLWGMFHGQGIDATKAFYDHLNVPFSPYHAHLIGYVEVIGGGLLLIGFLTRLAAVPLAITMLGAIWMLMSISGMFHNNHLIGLLICFVLIQSGGGPLSVDHLISRNSKGK